METFWVTGPKRVPGEAPRPGEDGGRVDRTARPSTTACDGPAGGCHPRRPHRCKAALPAPAGLAGRAVTEALAEGLRRLQLHSRSRSGREGSSRPGDSPAGGCGAGQDSACSIPRARAGAEEGPAVLHRGPLQGPSSSRNPQTEDWLPAAPGTLRVLCPPALGELLAFRGVERSRAPLAEWRCGHPSRGGS